MPMRTLEVTSEVVEKVVNTKTDALNTIESLFINDEISIDKYQLLRNVINVLDEQNEFDLGEGLRIKLVDTLVQLKEEE